MFSNNLDYTYYTWDSLVTLKFSLFRKSVLLFNLKPIYSSSPFLRHVHNHRPDSWQSSTRSWSANSRRSTPIIEAFEIKWPLLKPKAIGWSAKRNYTTKTTMNTNCNSWSTMIRTWGLYLNGKIDSSVVISVVV